MVKKISGTTPSKSTTAASGVKGSESVQGAEQVDSIQQVGGVQPQGRTEKVRRQTRPMTPQEREQLLNMVDEEAEKLFSAQNIPEKRRRTLTQAVKLTVAAGFIDIDDEENSK